MTPLRPIAFAILLVTTPAGTDGATGAVRAAQSQSSVDRMIERAFDDVLGRRPDSREIRLYRTRVYEEDWTDRDIRAALRRQQDDRDRPGRGNGGYGNGDNGSRPTSADVDRIITRAYQDILDRDPDAQGLREYGAAGWTMAGPNDRCATPCDAAPRRPT